MKLDNGIQELTEIDEKFATGEIPIHYVQSLIRDAFFNNLPDGILHPSDGNEIDRIVNNLTESVEMIEFCELSENHVQHVSNVLTKSKQKLRDIFEEYPKRAKDWG